MLGAWSSSQLDEFITRRRHEKLDVYYISQSCFGLPRRSIRNNSDRLIIRKQTLRGVEKMYKILEVMIWNMMNSKKCVLQLGVKYSIISVLIWVKIEMKVNKVISLKAKTHIFFVNFFDYHKRFLQLLLEKIWKN